MQADDEEGDGDGDAMNDAKSTAACCIVSKLLSRLAIFWNRVLLVLVWLFLESVLSEQTRAPNTKMYARASMRVEKHNSERCEIAAQIP